MAATVVSAGFVNRIPYEHEGLVPFWGQVEVPAASLNEDGDCVLLFKFPAGAYLPTFGDSLKLKTDDLDSGVTSDIDLGIGDSDGVLDTTIMSGQSIGQAAGVHELDANLDPMLDVGEKYLIMRQTAATAGAQAGTIEFAGYYIKGTIKHTSDLT